MGRMAVQQYHHGLFDLKLYGQNHCIDIRYWLLDLKRHEDFDDRDKPEAQPHDDMPRKCCYLTIVDQNREVERF